MKKGTFKQFVKKFDLTLEENKKKYILFIVFAWTFSILMTARTIKYQYNSNFNITYNTEEKLTPVGEKIFNGFNHTEKLTVYYNTIDSKTVYGLYNPFTAKININSKADTFTYVHEYVHHLRHIKRLPLFKNYKTPYDEEELTDIIAYHYILDERNPNKDLFIDSEYTSYYVDKSIMERAMTKQDTAKIVKYYLDFEFNEKD